MDLDAFLGAAWDEHARDARAVFERLPRGIELVKKAGDLPGLAALVVHVAGEHLGLWDDGLALLGRMEELPAFDPVTKEGKAVLRSKAVLHFTAGRTAEFERCLTAGSVGGDVPASSDRARVLAIASAALAGQKRTDEAVRAFEQAVALAGETPARTDPATRALAVTANNLAADLEERATLDDRERELMLRAARAARRYWELAGGWMEVERAEYRLAHGLLRSGDARAALGHAELCKQGVLANGSDPGELFFAHEALAKVRHALGEATAARAERDAASALLPRIADESFRSYCRDQLAKLPF